MKPDLKTDFYLKNARFVDSSEQASNSNWANLERQ